jgi:hypothetical protein
VERIGDEGGHRSAGHDDLRMEKIDQFEHVDKQFETTVTSCAACLPKLAVIHRCNRDASPETTRGAHFLISADAIPRCPVTNTGGGFPEISAERQRNQGNTTGKCENEHQRCDEGLRG